MKWQLLTICTLSLVSYSVMAAEPSDLSARQQEGKAVYDYLCSRCHAIGQEGAPRVGHAEDWQGRAGFEQQLLVKHASEGYLGMPASGGESRFDTDAIAAAVEYMLLRSVGPAVSPQGL